MWRFFLLHTIILVIHNACADTDKNILQFKSYLKNLDSIAADFTQNDSHDLKAKGKLLISKPYKFRCNYYPPFPLLIVGNTNFVSVYDYDMEQLSRIKTEENVFNFLLIDGAEIDKNIDFESFEIDEYIFKATFYHAPSARRSSITFDNLGKLKSLVIYEDGNYITINFEEIKQVVNFQEDLFTIRDPNNFDAPKRLKKDELEKQYQLKSK
ncbi:MAG: outer membrane lipoprotein carrier protein LolA [Rickettsiaceae bacterium]|nr:MAG: outer membrane lipoprotein carrier protein LolA [Rickettsiaceae bacterium]